MAPSTSKTINVAAKPQIPPDPRTTSAVDSPVVGKAAMVFVGPSEIPFLVHRGILFKSTYFQRALGGDFEEARTGEVRMPEDDPKAFGLYVHWLYTEKILCKPKEAEADWNTHRDNEYIQLISAYVLGDKLGDNEFMNTLMNAIICLWFTQDKEGNKRPPQWAAVNLAYEGLVPRNNPLKRWLRDVYVSHACRYSFTDRGWPEKQSEFFFDLCGALASRRIRTSALEETANASHYHQPMDKVAKV